MKLDKPTFDFTQVSRQIDEASGKGHPPLDKWNPEFCGDINLRIKRDGTWLYEGTPIGRASMVKLFSTVLWKEGDAYFLKTPVEKVGIQVDDVPFHFIHMEVCGSGDDQVLLFTSQTGDRIEASKQFPLRVETSTESGEPSPYLAVRYGMEGLINRTVFYELVSLDQEEEVNGTSCLVVHSHGERFILGQNE